MLDPHSTDQSNPQTSHQTILTIAVGNTRTRVGVLIGKECMKAQSVRSDEPEQVASLAGALFEEFDFPADEPVILIASVADAFDDQIEQAIKSRLGWSSYRLGRDIDIPIRHTLTESGEETVGQDRLLCALGAFDVLKQACVVVDMGTAITVDFVDGEGVFHGGAIMPGIAAMLESLHQSTANLPALKFAPLDPKSCEPAKQTDSAMLLGVCAAAKGGIRALAERYAQFYEGYPQIVATGGDMGVLEDDELIEAFIPDLQLQGIRVACSKFLAGDLGEDIETDLETDTDDDLGED